jgi:hypothetical protein
MAPGGGHLPGTMEAFDVGQDIGATPEGEGQQGKGDQDDDGDEKVDHHGTITGIRRR